ncbi:hypothetical protein [Pseudomonas glycinae]|nr:hypothetical protein [Pseudomonas glycinae]
MPLLLRWPLRQLCLKLRLIIDLVDRAADGAGDSGLAPAILTKDSAHG